MTIKLTNDKGQTLSIWHVQQADPTAYILRVSTPTGAIMLHQDEMEGLLRQLATYVLPQRCDRCKQDGCLGSKSPVCDRFKP